MYTKMLKDNQKREEQSVVYARDQKRYTLETRNGHSSCKKMSTTTARRPEDGNGKKKTPKFLKILVMDGEEHYFIGHDHYVCEILYGFYYV